MVISSDDCTTYKMQILFKLLVSFVGPFAVYKKTLTKMYCSNDSCKDFFGVIFGMLIIDTKKLLSSDWLRKEYSSSVTRVQNV